MIRLFLTVVISCSYLVFSESVADSGVGDFVHLFSKSLLYVVQVYALYVIGKIYCIELYKLSEKSYYARLIEYLLLPLVVIYLTANYDTVNDETIYVFGTMFLVIYILLSDINGVIRGSINNIYSSKEIFSSNQFGAGKELVIFGVIFYGLIALLVIKHSIRPVF